MKISDFDFFLPDEYIAEFPVSPRDSSRLAYLNNFGEIQEYKFNQIISLIDEGDVLVFNDSKVIPSYIEGHCEGKKVSFNFTRCDFTEGASQNINILAKPRKHLGVGKNIKINNNLEFEVISLNEDGTCNIKFNGNASELLAALEQYGQMPIPPYIFKKRGLKESDKTDYQTLYAKNQGSVAAPTAGLHFTEELLNKLKIKGIKFAFVTLHVGAGTFLPIKTDNIKDHKMHYEVFDVSRETSGVINDAKRSGKKIICVGTTSLRAIESSANEKGEVIPQIKETNIFISPGYKFKIVDRLITNFHLPKSTLIILISAFSGIENVKKLYQFAITNKFRFFSYGDACLLDVTTVAKR